MANGCVTVTPAPLCPLHLVINKPMFKIFGILGLLLITIGVLIKSEKKQDIFFAVGGLSLLVYSIYINDWIFIVLQIVFILTAVIELIKLRLKK